MYTDLEHIAKNPMSIIRVDILSLTRRLLYLAIYNGRNLPN